MWTYGGLVGGGLEMYMNVFIKNVMCGICFFINRSTPVFAVLLFFCVFICVYETRVFLFFCAHMLDWPNLIGF